MLNIALPKGRLGDQVYEMLAEIGYACPEMAHAGRKLIFESPENNVRYMLVKPSDVGIYVEHGVADIGILGKDILEETHPNVYELADLGLGKCRMAVAAPRGFVEDKGRTLRVATKFANIAKAYYARQNRDIEIIHLSGSIEIAPIVGLSDVIVDIVESGSTLRENNLVVLTEFMPISARLIANKTSFLFHNEQITAVAAAMTDRLTRKEEGR
ncbi:MAG TPA: ATP phosphoribosyltransferase [Clostridiales bacterium]|jgi:ATP phosphoribosyltransferase|nr:ATP phosphoribosyltransferase [Clostridiales bacterium]